MTFNSLKGESPGYGEKGRTLRQGNIKSKGLGFTILGELGKGQSGCSRAEEGSRAYDLREKPVGVLVTAGPCGPLARLALSLVW